ncbi:hypothetical protein SLE2022_398110 [Rubroshorea leprosula]
MDSAVNVESETGLETAGVAVGEKRPLENGEVSSVKKRRCGPPEAMKRVAEIVLLLSAMAKMRGGGRSPTDVELGLMTEARQKLVEICGELAPGDIVGRDAIGAVIEDLGLNAKLKEQRLGFRMPRLTILERFSIAKKKMEESKKFQAPSPTYASQLLRTANSSPNHSLVNAPTWSLQSPPGVSKLGQENKVLNHNSAKAEGSPDMSMSQVPQAERDLSFRPFITQSPSGTFPTHAMNYVHAPPFINNHNEIAKIVQNLLQPKLPEHPTWTPPSRDYMNKALTCQTCKLTINEVETVLICDACEKGFHLKCLQPNTLRGIPRGEWHCTRCLSLCNGKPLPPKYGRVMRSINTAKALTNSAVGQSDTAEAQLTARNKVGNPDAKVNQPKKTENGSSGLQPPAVPGTTGSSSVRSAPDPKISTNVERLDPESKSQPPDTFSNQRMEGSHHSQASHGMQDVDMGKQNSAEIPLNKFHEVNSTVEDVEKSHMRADGDCGTQIKQNKQDATLADPAQSSGPSLEVTNHTEFSSDVLHAFEWIGDVIQLLDRKKFYHSCCIGGVTYRVHDHALLHFSNEKLAPSKLQAMWEDAETGRKFVDVRRCYFPSDLPETVGRPYTPESSEVYESNNDITVMVGLIRGPCEVLPATKFKEESEKRSQLGTKANKESRPIFLCRWLYDEPKGSFQPVSG